MSIILFYQICGGPWGFPRGLQSERTMARRHSKVGQNRILSLRPAGGRGAGGNPTAAGQTGDAKGKKGFQGKETVVSFPWGCGVKCRRIVEQAKAPRSILVCPA